MAKPFLSYQQQLDKLINDKNLIINDYEYAIMKLKSNSYFSLISGYKHLFKNHTTKKYNKNTTFENIVDLYEFDEELRTVFLKYLLKFERHLKSLISYNFSQKFGENQTAYLTNCNYNYILKHQKQINEFIDILKDKINSKTNYIYIKHHIENHNNVPLWVLINALTFGNISKMYSFSNQSLQKQISCEFNGIKEDDLVSILSVITKFRNVCAHNERLFNYRTIQNSIPNLTIHKELNIPMLKFGYKYGKNDLFSVVISLKYLLSKNVFNNFIIELKANINNYFAKSDNLLSKQILNEMGFPDNWEEINLK